MAWNGDLNMKKVLFATKYCGFHINIMSLCLCRCEEIYPTGVNTKFREYPICGETNSK